MSRKNYEKGILHRFGSNANEQDNVRKEAEEWYKTERGRLFAAKSIRKDWLWDVCRLLVGQDRNIEEAGRLLRALTPGVRQQLHEQAKLELYIVVHGNSNSFSQYEGAKGDQKFYTDIFTEIERLKKEGKQDNLTKAKLARMAFILGIDLDSHTAGIKDAKTKHTIIVGALAILAVGILICLVAQPQITAIASSQFVLSTFTSANATTMQLIARSALGAVGAVGAYAFLESVRGACRLIQGALFSGEKTSELLQGAIEKIDKKLKEMGPDEVLGTEPEQKVEVKLIEILEKEILDGLDARVKKKLCSNPEVSYKALKGECSSLVAELVEEINLDALKARGLEQEIIKLFIEKEVYKILMKPVKDIYINNCTGFTHVQATALAAETIKALKKKLDEKVEEVFRDKPKASFKK